MYIPTSIFCTVCCRLRLTTSNKRIRWWRWWWYRLNKNHPTLQKTQCRFSIALRNHDVNLAQCYLCENFMEDKLTVFCGDLPWTFHGISIVGIIFRENWLRLRLLLLLLNFFVINLLQICCSCAKKKRFIKSVCQSRGWSTKRTRKEFFSIKKWAVISVEAQCKTQKTNTIKWKTGAERPQTARSKQNYRHVTELICSQEGNTGSSRSRREMINLTAISLSSGCCENCCGHKHVIDNVFSHCVKTFLGASIIS